MNMKVNKVIAVKLLLSLVMIIGFASCSKNPAQKAGVPEPPDGKSMIKGGFQYANKFKSKQPDQVW